MRAKNKMTQIAANAFLALSMIAGVAGFTTLQARAEGRSYEPYAVSFGGSDVPDKERRSQYITQCYVPTRSYGMDNDSSWHYFSDSYCKEGVGFQLRNRSDLKVEPTFAGGPNSGIGDPSILIGGLKAKLVKDSNNVVKLHVEGKYELNLKTVWTTDERQGTGQFDPGYQGSDVTDPKLYKDHQDWLEKTRRPEGSDGKEIFKNYEPPASGIEGSWGPGDPEIHYWYYPRIYYIQLLVNGNIYKVPLQLPNNKMIYDKDAILHYPEEIFAGNFSQDIYLPGKNFMDKGQSTLSQNPAYQMKVSDLNSVIIDWVLSTNTKCGIAVPLNGTEADCSKHYIEDVGIIDIVNHNDDGNADYTIGFISNAMNANQADGYNFELEYSVGGKTNVVKKYVTLLRGERKHAEVTVTLPKGAQNFVVKNLYSSSTGTTDTYRYYVKDFRLIIQDTSTPDRVTKVSGAAENTITVNIQRKYKIYHDPMRGVFDREYPNIAGNATEEMKNATYLAEFEYEMKDPETGLRKKYTKNKTLTLKEKSGTIDLSIDFPGNAEKIKLLDIVSPRPYDFKCYCGKVLYRSTDGLPKPTEFSADFTATTQIISSLKVREVKLRVDYGSPNTHKYELMMEYFDDEKVNTVVYNSGKDAPYFIAAEGYHSIGFGDMNAENPGGVYYQPIHTIPKTCKFIRIVGVKDKTDGTVYKYNQYIYCEHKYKNDCDDDCDWCGAIRETDEHKYEWIIDKEPTETEDGIKHEECKICGKKKAPEFIPALGSGNDTKAGKDVKDGEDAKDGKGANDGKDVKDGKDTKDGKDVKDGKGTNDGKGSVGDIIMGNDGTLVGPGANIVAVDHAILGNKSEEDPAGAVFGKLQLKAKKTTKKSIKLSWKKISGCEYVVYGTKCGGKYKKLATTNKNTYTKKGLKKGQYYKFIVVALKDGKVVSTSKSVHAATKGKKVGNYKLVKLNKTKIILKKNKTFKLKAKQIKDSKQIKVRKHRALKYESSNTKVVKVTAKGKIKAVGKGTAYVYAYSQNGVFNKIKVKVK